MRRMWRRIERQPALFAGAVLVAINLVALSGVLKLSEQALGGINAAIAALLAFLVSAIASAQLSTVRRTYTAKAREQPWEVMQTAGGIIGEVVGRDQVCQVLIEDLKDPATRRPHVVVGGIETGKTALLVRLTELLARRDTIPVPVWLPDVQSNLDFRELARRRFLADTDAALLSDADGEKVWRQLCQDDRIVVLADGLDKALIEGTAESERDNLIRLAIGRAADTRLPLVITSRPQDPLRDVEAAIINLEPLSEEAALEYVRRSAWSEDERRLDWIVETADVVKTPLYLQITRQLTRAGLISASRDGWQLDTRSVDRAELRLRLLDTWTGALIRGYFPSGLPLSYNDRQATIEQISALACIGLRDDRLLVKFEALEGRDAPGGQLLREAVRQELRKLNSGYDIRLAATQGQALGLLEARGDGVRFPYSIMQAYFGSRLIHVAMEDPEYRNAALQNPGRELLLALVMHSRTKVSEGRANRAAGISTALATADGPGDPLQGLLAEAASSRDNEKALDLYAAALEIDSIDEAPTHAAIAGQLREHWPRISARDARTLEESKLNLVRRLGEAARTLVERRRREEPGLTAEPAYLELYRIIALEPMYPVRLAAAQEIGAGGDEALAALQEILGPQHPPLRPDPAPPDTDEPENATSGHEPSVDVGPPGDNREEECEWREKAARALLAPLLLGSASSRQAREAAAKNLERWLHFLTMTDRQPGESELRLSLEIALALGFKHAANRRDRHPHARREARAYLVEQAREMLRGTNFWFTRLTLVHALCLWSLPDGPIERPSTREPDIDPRTLVEDWVARPGGQPEHPFVLEAVELAILALETRQPEQFLWIDETGILGRVGSHSAKATARRKRNLWIPASAGWTRLHPRAQQLVADVLLLLNLAERGTRPTDRARRLRRTDRSDLPPCLTGDRTPLDPTRTVGMVATSEPGSNCKTACRFELCPYPPKGEMSYQAELSQAFARSQQTLVTNGWPRRRTAPWQTAPPRHLRTFWAQMEERAQPRRQARR